MVLRMDKLVELIDELKQAEYNRGLVDAWDLARRLYLPVYEGGIGTYLASVIFGCRYSDVLMKLTPQEALAKIEAYEKEQEQINVGDVVQVFGAKGVVVYANKGIHNVVHANGSLSVRLTKEQITKTGKHIDLVNLLAEIGKE